MAAQEAEVTRLTNAARAGNGCPALTVNQTLASVARAHSTDMGRNHYFDHNSLDGRSPFQRMTDAGYSYSAAAENIAAGQPTPAAVVDAWLNSPGHRANIMNCALRDIGVGLYSDGSQKVWTQDFGTSR